MRILFISAFYPPYVIGGWEQLVQDINVHLQARGHHTLVLTSNYQVPAGSIHRKDVHRLLHLESDLVHYRHLAFFRSHPGHLEHNLQITRDTLAEFRPDVVFVHGMWNLSRGIPWQAEQQLPGKVIYYVASDWPYAPSVHRQYWEAGAKRPLHKLLKRLLAPQALQRLEQEEQRFPLEFRRVLCVSQAVCAELHRQAGIPVENLRVVYNGVEVDRFVPRSIGSGPKRGLSILYAGSLVPHKGVHTAIQAIGLLAEKGELDGTSLTIVGSGNPEYEQGLRRMVAEKSLEDKVWFWPRVSREEMPALLSKFDALIFPSIWEEPLARMMQEAMASGLVVIGTPTGGTPEILENEITGLTFPPGDEKSLAALVSRLAADPQLRERLAANARRVVVERFNLDRMVDEIEGELKAVAERSLF